MHRRSFTTAATGAALACIAAGPSAAHEPTARSLQLQPAGQALLRVWGFEVYRARLWVAKGFTAADYAASPLLLELTYLRAFRGVDIARRSLQEMRRLEPFDVDRARQWETALQAVLPDVRPGERLSGLHRPGQGARFLGGQGEPLGPVDDGLFSRLFFGIWLSPRTSEPAMRTALLGPYAEAST